jgi:hypothetical protein
MMMQDRDRNANNAKEILPKISVKMAGFQSLVSIKYKDDNVEDAAKQDIMEPVVIRGV